MRVAYRIRRAVLEQLSYNEASRLAIQSGASGSNLCKGIGCDDAILRLFDGITNLTEIGIGNIDSPHYL